LVAEPRRALPAPPQPSTFDVTLAAFQALGYALSARALLLLSILGAFTLAAMAMQDPTTTRLLVVIAYAVLVVIPMTILEYRRRS
jgi:hypothetical protein